MERKKIFTGLGTALITPFLENGEIDWKSLEKLVDDQIANGVDFLCVLGTTAETPTLTENEKTDVFQFVLKRNAGRLPILVGCGGNCTASVIETLRSGKYNEADAILSVVPFYNKPTQEGMYRHFAAIAEASPLPIMLYNVPGRTGVNMQAATTLRLAREFSNICGIKEASGNVEQIKEIIAGRPEGFSVISGDDSLVMDLVLAGADGGISVISNALPLTFSKLMHASMKADAITAAGLQNRLADLYGMMFKEGSPSGVKALMSQRGKCCNVLRLPLVPVSEGFNKEIEIAFKDIKA